MEGKRNLEITKRLTEKQIEKIKKIYLNESNSHNDKVRKCIDLLNCSRTTAIRVFKNLKLRDLRKDATGFRAFKDLSQDDISYIRKIYFDISIPFAKRIDNLRKKFGGKDERTIRKWISRLGFVQKGTEDPQDYIEAKKRKFNKNTKTFIITWAQNNTPVHEQFLDNIKAYAKFREADIHIILGRYKNPTSVFTDVKEDFWVEEIQPYKDANRHNIHKHLAILSDVKIQPTATNPMSGLESITGLNSCIIGSPKVQLKVIPVLEGYNPKLILTTGAVTLNNYTDSKAGKKGDFHHVFGFAIVEIKDKDVYFVRQVTANNDGSFTDLFYHVKDEKINKVEGIDAAILGDKHIGQHCEVVEQQQIKWLDVLKPKYTVIHDVMDGYSVNHHEEKDPILMYYKEKEGTNSISLEIERMMEWLDKMKKYNLVIPSANHNDFLDRWVKRIDWKHNIKNAEKYMEFTNILLQKKAPDGLIAYLINQRFGKKIKTLGRNTSFVVNGWELGQHFDVGSNGSRGGIENFRRLNTKMVGGHSHVPSRMDGVIYAGTSTRLRLTYNIGASSWMNADVIIHKDKKAQHIIYFGDKKEFTTIKF